MSKISICLNVVLLGGLIFSMSGQGWHRVESKTAAFIAAETTPPTAVAAPEATPEPPQRLTQTFRWSQLESTNDYRNYVASLRAIGCPEATIEDIVNGDASRAFAFKRNQSGLGEAGIGPWSQYREQQLVATLLGKSTANPTLASIETTEPIKTESVQPTRQNQLAQSNTAQTSPAKQILPVPKRVQPVYPLAFRKVNLAALDFNSTQKSAIDQVQQQFVNDIGGSNQNPEDPAYLARWQSAQTKADDTLRGLLGNQAYMAYQQQQYYSWFKPKILAAAADGRSLEINPAAFSSTQ